MKFHTDTRGRWVVTALVIPPNVSCSAWQFGFWGNAMNFGTDVHVPCKMSFSKLVNRRDKTWKSFSSTCHRVKMSLSYKQDGKAARAELAMTTTAHGACDGQRFSKLPSSGWGKCYLYMYGIFFLSCPLCLVLIKHSIPFICHMLLSKAMDVLKVQCVAFNGI